MTVRVAGPGGRDRDPWPGGGDEGLGRGRPAAVVRDLEQIDRGQAGHHDVAIDALFDVAGQQEPSVADRPEHDDRYVVDASPGIGWLGGDPSADRPEDADRDLVDGQPVAGRHGAADRSARPGQRVEPGGVPWARAAHPGLEDPIDAIARQQQRQAGDMVLVRVGQDDDVDPAVPRGKAPVQLDEQAVRVGAAVDEQATPP